MKRPRLSLLLALIALAQIMLAGVAKQQGIIVLPESARGHWLTYCQTPEASEKLLMELARQRGEAYQTKGTFY